MQMTLEHYMAECLNRSTPIIDHSLRADRLPDGRIKFYIHPASVDGDTLDFVVSGNTLTPWGGECAAGLLNQQEFGPDDQHTVTPADFASLAIEGRRLQLETLPRLSSSQPLREKIRFHEWLVANADALLSAAERLVAAEQRIDGERIAALEAERDALKQERDRLQRAYKILREWGESIAKCADRWADTEDARKALAMAREVLGE